MGKDSKPKESAKKGKGKQASSGEEEKTSKGKGKGGKSGDELGTCTYVKARHILCEKQGQINEAYKKLQEGWLSNGDKVPPAEFAKVAAEYSECPSGKKGGDLGWFPRGKMAGPFQEVAFSTPVGATTAPFKSTMKRARMDFNFGFQTLRHCQRDISEEQLELLEISAELKALRQRKRVLLEKRQELRVAAAYTKENFARIVAEVERLEQNLSSSTEEFNLLHHQLETAQIRKMMLQDRLLKIKQQIVSIQFRL